jgi:hypothetical protein
LLRSTVAVSVPTRPTTELAVLSNSRSMARLIFRPGTCLS